MGLSLNQAAKQGKVAKTTLLRALKSGEVTGTKTDNGQWKIESSELVRWLGSRTARPRVTADQNILDHHNKTHEKPPENSSLEIEIQALRERIADKDSTIEDLRRRLDAETDERRELTKMLTVERAHKEKRGRGLWGRLFSRG